MSDPKHDSKEGPRVAQATTVPDAPPPSSSASPGSPLSGSARPAPVRPLARPGERLAERLASDLFLDEAQGATQTELELPTPLNARAIRDRGASAEVPPVRVSSGPASSSSPPPASIATSFESRRWSRPSGITGLPLQRPIALPPPQVTVVDPPRFPERSDPAGAKEVEVHDRIEQPTQPIDVSGYQELPLPAVDPAPRAPAPPAPLALPNAVKPQPLFASLLFPEDHGDPRSEPRPPAIAPAAAPRIEVALPANVLIIDDDTRAASAVAAKLLEHGYGCKIARSDGASLALSREHFDAVVIEIPPEEARKSLGKERLGVLADFHGPAIVTSAAVLRLDLLRATPQVRAVLTKPYFVEVLVQSIEAARVPFSTDLSAPERRSAPLEPKRAAPVATAASPVPAAPSSSPPGPALVPIERRSARRHELDVNVVRVVISGPGVQTVRGRVRNLSNNGGMLIDTSIRLPLKTPVTAELTLFDGRMMIFSGRVVRTMSNDLAIRFDVDDTQHAFLDLYIAEARAPNQRAIQPLRVSMREQGTTEDIIDDMMLMKRWLEVSERIEDDDIQQRFIQDCLKAERIEFAVARYRELKLQRPEDERVAKYLQQIGTILSFYAFQKKDPAQKERPKIPASLKIVIGIFILAGIALGLILQRAMH